MTNVQNIHTMSIKIELDKPIPVMTRMKEKIGSTMRPQYLKHSNRADFARRARLVSWVLAGGLLASMPTNLSAGDQPKSLSFELEDQFGDRHSTGDLEGKPVILIGGDRAGRQGSQDWALTVGKLLETDVALQGRAEVLRIADLRGVPGFLKGTVTKQLRKSLSTSLLLDWDGQVVSPYGFQPNLANVVLLDREGAVLLRIESSQPREEEIGELKEALLDLEDPSSREASQWKNAILLGSCL